VKTWLDALFRPYATAAYCVVRAQHGLPPVSVPAAGTCLPAPTPSPTLSAEASTTGHLALFNQRLQQENKHVEWLYSDQHPFGMDSSAPPASGGEAFQHGSKATPIWSVQVVVDGEVFGRGKGNTKKAARNEAAKQGLARMGLNVWWVFLSLELLFCTLTVSARQNGTCNIISPHLREGGQLHCLRPRWCAEIMCAAFVGHVLVIVFIGLLLYPFAACNSHVVSSCT
jgi:hypothetical protein